MTMYLEHFGLREPPFRITPHTEFFFSGANRGETLEALIYAVMAGEGLVKVTGEVGTGKTMLCRVLIERLPESVETIYLAVPSLNRDELLVAIAAELGFDPKGCSTTQLLRELQQILIALHIVERRVVAIIDEAHAMPLATLEELRLLSNMETGKEKLLQIVLFGQPELDAHLSDPKVRQIKERITHSFSLAPLPPRDIEEYIDFRLRAAGYRGPDLFNAATLRIIAEASEGLTRRVNIYADKTLLAAFAEGTHTVTVDHARAAISDTQVVMAPRTSSRRIAWMALVGLAAGIAIGIGAAIFLSLRPAVPSAPPAASGSPPTQGAPSPAHAAPVQPPAASSASPTPAPAPQAQPPASAPAEPVQPPAAAPGSPGKTSAAPVTAPATTPGNTIALGAQPPPAALAGAERAGRGGPEPPESKVPIVIPTGSQFYDRITQKGPAGGERYLVQMVTTDASERRYLEHYLKEATRSLDPGQLFVFRAGSEASPQYGVLYGTFASRAEANEAMGALPDNLRKFRPFVRSLEELRDAGGSRPAGAPG